MKDITVRLAIFNKLDDVPLKYKFILIYVLCVLIPIVTINWVFMYKISALVKEREVENFRIAMERARIDIVGLIEGGVAVSHSISTDRLLVEALNRRYHDFNQFYDAYDSYLRDRLNRYASIYSHLSELRIFTQNDTIPSSGHYLYLGVEIKRKEWYQAFTKSERMIVLTAYREINPSLATTSDQYLCIIRKMNDYPQSGPVQNFIKINVDINRVFEVFNREHNYLNLCLVDQDNRIIAAPNNPLFYRSRLSKAKYHRDLFAKDSIILSERLGGASYFAGWRIVGVADAVIILKALRQSRYFILCVAVISMLVATLLIFIIVRSFNYRLTKIAKHMLKVKDGQFELITVNEGQDEIGGLIKSFNLMTAKINTLINDVYRLKLQKKDLEIERVRAELKFLQSQMNPHFLFNTLNAILAVCVKNNYKEISEVLKYLSKTLRRLLSWKEDLVTVEEELAFSEMYLKIEKFRFGEKVRYEITVDQSALACYIPKMSIQPLIENACKHGIQSLKDSGMIQIKVTLTDDVLQVKVRDNGSGIESAKLDEIVLDMGHMERVNGSIGICNVYRRLKLYYGDEVSFNICSELNCGTEVSFSLPVAKKGVRKVNLLEEGGISVSDV